MTGLAVYCIVVQSCRFSSFGNLEASIGAIAERAFLITLFVLSEGGDFSLISRVRRHR